MYTCPMHPEVRQETEGKCPKCGMKLVPADQAQSSGATCSMGGMCFNWKVLAGLGVLAVGVLAFQPQLFWTALPILAVLACPLSMLFMMRGMGQPQQSTPAAPASASPESPGLEDLRHQMAALESQRAELAYELEALKRRSRSDQGNGENEEASRSLPTSAAN